MAPVKSPVGLGIIGCGAISVHHIRESQKDKRLRWVAACDINPQMLNTRADEFEIPGRYGSMEDLIADPAVDAVVVATPPPAHVGPAVAAMKAGKHVLVEKPIAVNTGEVEEMIRARGAGTVAACCSCRFRATATARRATEMIRSGELGAVQRLVCTALGPPPAKLDGTGPLYLYRPNWGKPGILGDWGCYDLDFLMGICGWLLRPKTVLADVHALPTVYARMHPPLNEAEVQFSAKFRFESGVTFDFRRAGYFAGPPRNEWLVECEEGTIELSMTPSKPQITVHRYGPSGVECAVALEGPDTWGAVLGGPVLDFVGAILEGRPPLTGLEQSLLVQRMTDAIYASAESGQAVVF